ncbi:MAG TPA: hydantoinase/oxoprolinase family protein [Rhodopila sp.]|uniref:hydantoinase/oxoprolinase family protein n=1 Tax=Rhodopila sp. TaxID=2480087 RepID=UPI002C4E714C|nr:hydantoinase/oxoprolinase family protein [Rhodopila sp.]HVY16739.1 hydantoinase/oxoprolinase family protein [Rhodopila sp.]
MACMIGVDIGGTFADFVALDTGSGQMTTLKVLTTPLTPGQDVGTGLRRLVAEGLSPTEVGRFVHGTTVGVNTIIQRRGARIALFTTAGFTDMLELARLRMPDPYSLFCERPAPLVPREHVFPIHERMSASGATLQAPKEADVAAALAAARAADCDVVVVSFLHAWRKPLHEEQVAAMIARLDPAMIVFRGSEVWPAIREYERTTTAVLNAYVHPRIANYLDRVSAELEGLGITAPLLLTTSAGGTMTARHGRRDCVGMLLSGTASGVVGAGVVARAAGVPAVLTLDMGGTSADAAILIDGQPSYSTGLAVGEFPLATTTVAVTSSGQGGGSMVWIDPQGVLQVGPESAGSTPGPACFGRGGTRMTVTDAALLCGILGHGALGYGAIAPNAALAEDVARPLAAQLGMDLQPLAEGVLHVAVSGMLVPIEQLLARAGVHASELTLMPFGGAGPMLGALLAEAAGMTRVLVPAVPGTLCALGAVAAAIRRDTMRTVLAPLEAAEWPKMQAMLDALAAEAEAGVTEMAGPGDTTTLRAADLRYRGQSFELTVPIPAEAGPEALARLFHEAHDRAFGHAEPGAPVQVVSLRASATRAAPPIAMPRAEEVPHAVQPGLHVPLYLRGGWQQAGLIDRTALDPGAMVQGPAIVTQPDCTILVPDGWRARVDGLRNLQMEHG